MVARIRIDIVPAIQWHEGMMLSSHHFQQSDLRMHQIITKRFGLISPNGYGINYIEYDKLVLGDGLLRILEFEALMPDGEIVDYSSKFQEILELDLTSYREEKTRELLIWCGLPEWNQEVSPLNKENPRYKIIEGEPVAENQDPSNVITIPRLVPILSLYVSDKPKENMVSVPFLKLICTNGLFEERDFVPPCLELPKESSIGQQLLVLTKFTRDKVNQLSQKYKSEMGSVKESYTRATLEPLQVILPSFEQITSDNPLHPFVLYQNFTNIIGRLSTLRPFETVPKMPLYKHDDLISTFMPIIQMVKNYLEGIHQNYTLIPFDMKSGAFTISTTLAGNKSILIGIKFKKEMPLSERIAWVKNTIIVSQEKLDQAITKRITGAERTILNIENFPAGLYCVDDIVIRIDIDEFYVKKDSNLVIINPMDEGSPKPLGVFLCINELEN